MHVVSSCALQLITSNFCVGCPFDRSAISYAVLSYNDITIDIASAEYKLCNEKYNRLDEILKTLVLLTEKLKYSSRVTMKHAHVYMSCSGRSFILMFMSGRVVSVIRFDCVNYYYIIITTFIYYMYIYIYIFRPFSGRFLL